MSEKQSEINKYWLNFYNSVDTSQLEKESGFARFVHETLRQRNEETKGIRVVDFGCGNCRDSIFFLREGYDVSSVDSGCDYSDVVPKFHKMAIDEYDITAADVLYLRFVVHALPSDYFIELLDKWSLYKGKIVCIETRSSKFITDEHSSETYFRSPIGESHFRQLYSLEHLSKLLSRKMKILHASESRGYAKFGSEDPSCLRFVCEI